MKGKGKAFLIILAIFSALFFISDVSQAAITPECPTGYTYNSIAQSCQANPPCPNGSYDATANYCKSDATYICPSGYSYNASSYQCELDPPCPNGSYDATANNCKSDATYTCPSEYSYNASSYQCELDPPCPNGTYDATANYCKSDATYICPSGYSYNASSYQCELDPPCSCGSYDSASNVCTTPANFTYDSNGNIIAITCSCGTYSYWPNKVCIQGVQCPDGGAFNGNIDKCRKDPTFTCPTGYNYNLPTLMCVKGVQCLGGGAYYSSIDECQVNPYPDISDVNNTCEVRVGLPVSIASGVVYATETDFTINGIIPITFTRYHNSKAAQTRGYWTSSFDTRVEAYNSTYSIYKITNPDSSITYYNDINGDTIYEADFPRGETSKLIKNTGNTFKRIYKDGSSEEFNTSGYLTAIVDKNGNRLTLTRDTANKLTKITDPSARESNITTDTSGKITTITLPDGKIYSYTYIAGTSFLGTVTYPDGNKKTYEYAYITGIGYRLAGIKNEKGNYIEKHTYDAQGRGITSSADGTNDLLTINYTNDTQTTVTDSLGRTTTYTYDKTKGKGHLISRTGPGCQSCGQGNVAYTYDDKLNITTETDAIGNVTAYTYDASASGGGNMLTKTEASGTSLQRTTTYTYNSQNDLIEQTNPDGAKTQYQYDTKRNLIKVQILNSSLEVLSQITFTRNTKGQITQVIDNQNNTTNIAYDTYGNITSTTDALNNTTTYTYDIMGKPLTATDANGKTTTLTYDQRARLISTKDSLNNITAYTYDQAGSLITLTDAKSNATQFTYDLIGRLTKQTDPMAKQTTYTYDTQGNLTSKTDPLTNTIQYTYDALNRLILKTYPDASASGGTTTYQYDAIGNMTAASNSYITYKYTYNALNQITQTQILNPNLETLNKINYTYDANGNRTQMQVLNPNNQILNTINYQYNALDQLLTLESLNPPLTFNFVYDTLDRRTMLTMPNGTKTNYTYNNISNLLTLSHLNPMNQPFKSFTYTYDNIGNNITKQDSTGTHNYAYDNTYQLTQATHPTIPTESFAYDAVGNRTNTTVDAANKLLQDPNASYQYDNNGNRYIKTQTDGSITYYSYDYEGRLTRVETQKPGLTTIAVYKYDALGRRIEKAVTENNTTTTTRYLYNGFNIIAEYDDNNNVKAQYIHNLGIDDQLAMIKNGNTYYYHKDGLDSITAITDSSANVVQTYEYDSFGNIINQTGAINQPYTFTGREYDPETGMLFYRARELDSKTGTFTQKDPIGFGGGDVNLYRYVGNDPINWIDPEGFVIVVKGSSSFKKKTNAELKKIQSTASGKALYNVLNKSKKTHKIVESNSGNACSPNSGYSLGKGTGSTIEFDPNSMTGGVDSTGSTNRPPFVGLSHEMGHSEDIDQGTQTFNRGTGAPGTIPPSEKNSIRRENQIRHEHNIPLRPSYY